MTDERPAANGAGETAQLSVGQGRKMPRPEAVIFDIGNVLIEWRPERFYDRLIGQARRRALFAEVDLHAMNDRIDRGENFRDVVYATADATPRWRAEIRLWHDEWTALAGPVMPRSLALMRALQNNGVPVFALTNFGVGSFAVAEVHYPFLKAFDRLYVSGRMKVAKPDSAIYAGVEADCGIAPGRLLFTDDRAENIGAARARGWRTHLFTGPDGLAVRLAGEGLLSARDAGI